MGVKLYYLDDLDTGIRYPSATQDGLDVYITTYDIQNYAIRTLDIEDEKDLNIALDMALELGYAQKNG